MGYYLMIAIGLIGPFVMIKYRETIGDLFGEADWMRKVGGVYNIVLIVALIIFFWTIAELTGTTSVLFAPLRSMMPGLNHSPEPTF